MPHIHLTILISASWSATFSFLTGQVSLPCNTLLRTPLLNISKYIHIINFIHTFVWITFHWLAQGQNLCQTGQHVLSTSWLANVFSERVCKNTNIMLVGYNNFCIFYNLPSTSLLLQVRPTRLKHNQWNNWTMLLQERTPSHACTHARTQACMHACMPARLHARTHTHTHTHTHTILRPLGFCLGPARWAGTRKVKPIWINWSKELRRMWLLMPKKESHNCTATML